MTTLTLLPGAAQEVAQVAARLRRSLVMVRGQWNGSGSGIIWGNGIVLSNDHVVRRDQARLTLADGRQVDATVVGRDKGLDLAALRTPDLGLPAAPVGASRGLKVGQVVVAVGNPLGVEGATTLGIISAVGRVAPGGRELVEADIDVYPGNSGGPLADTEGRVVGITSMILTPGVALAVPAHVAETMLARWLGDAPRRDRLGIRGWAVPLPPPWAQAAGQPSGIMLGEVLPASYAEEAGLLVGDILVGVDDEPTPDAEALQRLLNSRNAIGRVRVLRGGQVTDLAGGYQV